MENEQMMVLYVTNDPTDGFELIGPFSNAEESVEWAETHLKNAMWWVTVMTTPEGSLK